MDLHRKRQDAARPGKNMRLHFGSRILSFVVEHNKSPVFMSNFVHAIEAKKYEAFLSVVCLRYLIPVRNRQNKPGPDSIKLTKYFL